MAGLSRRLAALEAIVPTMQSYLNKLSDEELDALIAQQEVDIAAAGGPEAFYGDDRELLEEYLERKRADEKVRNAAAGMRKWSHHELLVDERGYPHYWLATGDGMVCSRDEELTAEEFVRQHPDARTCKLA